MAKDSSILTGTLDLLILQIVSAGPLHGWGIVQRLRLLSDEVLSVQQGSLYPALHKLEGEGLLDAEWKSTEEGRHAKFYRLTARGRRRLKDEKARWQKLSSAVHAVTEPRA